MEKRSRNTLIIIIIIIIISWEVRADARDPWSGTRTAGFWAGFEFTVPHSVSGQVLRLQVKAAMGWSSWGAGGSTKGTRLGNGMDMCEGDCCLVQR